MALLSVKNLSIGVDTPGGKLVVNDVSFSIEAGQVAALIGESGSGKTTIALSALGYTKPGLAFRSGEVWLDGKEILTQPTSALRELRGADVCYMAQSAAAAFDPAMRLMDQIVEASVLHGRMSASEARARALQLFEVVRLPNPDTIGDRYPHQVSGGQLQRLMLVMALCPRPKLLVLDEPTTALDVTTQISVLESIRDAISKEETAAIYVSHDLAVVGQIADKAVVLYRGRVREIGDIGQVISAPKDRYTKSLINAVTTGATITDASIQGRREQVISVSDVDVGYGGHRVVHDASLSIARGEIVALIGESGSGKSTLAKAIAGIAPAKSGQIKLNELELQKDLRARNKEHKRAIQYVPQMADTALNPTQKVGATLSRPITFYGLRRGADVQTRAMELMDQMSLDSEFMQRAPHELSGGQKQRVNLARALAADPEVLLCDEVTSALDALVADRIIRLLRKICDDTSVSILFISHDISTVSAISDRIVVLYGGQVVEAGTRAEVLSPPYHPYTRLLLVSSPEMRLGWLDETVETNEVQAGNRAVFRHSESGCPFFERCPLAIPGTCDTVLPPTQGSDDSHEIRCHRPIGDLVYPVDS